MLGYSTLMSVNRINLRAVEENSIVGLVDAMQEKASMSKRATIIVLLVGGFVSMICAYLYLAWDLDGDYVTPLAAVAAFLIVYSVLFVVAVRKIRRDEHTRSRTSGEM